MLLSASLGTPDAGADHVGTREPGPLTGASLHGRSHLRLLVANNPPFTLQVDSAGVSPIHAPSVMRTGVLWIVPVGGRSGVIVSRYPKAHFFAATGSKPQLIDLGTGRDVVPDSDGTSVWIRTVDATGCSLRHLSMDGRQLGPPLRLTCGTTLRYGGRLGLIESDTEVVDPRTGRTVLTATSPIVAVAGRRLVLAGPGREFTLLDSANGSKRTLRWPSILRGLGEASTDYQGRYVALTFADPAWQSTAAQVLDIWILDTQTGDLAHLPGMPAFVDLKFTSIQWTRDERLVLLAQSDKRGYVAIWKAGADQLVVKPVRLPTRTSGSNSFVLLP
jgi:hypothetical protein